VDNAVKEAFKGKPYNIDYRIVPADGAERIVLHKVRSFLMTKILLLK